MYEITSTRNTSFPVRARGCVYHSWRVRLNEPCTSFHLVLTSHPYTSTVRILRFEGPQYLRVMNTSCDIWNRSPFICSPVVSPSESLYSYSGYKFSVLYVHTKPSESGSPLDPFVTMGEYVTECALSKRGPFL